MTVDQSNRGPGKPRWSLALHDVSPRNWRDCARWTELCASLGLSPPALFVIPDHRLPGEGTGSGLPPDFVAWLRARHAAGAQLWMHGFTHCGASGAPGDEAEFEGLDGPAASERLREGLAIWRAAGLPGPVGFCPPTWRIGRAGIAAARASGFSAFDLRFGRLIDGQFTVSPALSSWGGAALPARVWDRTIRAQAAILAWVPAHVRIALHPQDSATAAGAAFSRILATLAAGGARLSGQRREQAPAA